MKPANWIVDTNRAAAQTIETVDASIWDLTTVGIAVLSLLVAGGSVVANYRISRQAMSTTRGIADGDRRQRIDEAEAARRQQVFLSDAHSPRGHNVPRS